MQLRLQPRLDASAQNAQRAVAPVSADESSSMPLPVGRPRAGLPGNVLAILSAKYFPPRR
jgi:hypothetical protein